MKESPGLVLTYLRTRFEKKKGQGKENIINREPSTIEDSLRRKNFDLSTLFIKTVGLLSTAN